MIQIFLWSVFSLKRIKTPPPHLKSIKMLFLPCRVPYSRTRRRRTWWRGWWRWRDWPPSRRTRSTPTPNIYRGANKYPWQHYNILLLLLKRIREQIINNEKCKFFTKFVLNLKKKFWIRKCSKIKELYPPPWWIPTCVPLYNQGYWIWSTLTIFSRKTRSLFTEPGTVHGSGLDFIAFGNFVNFWWKTLNRRKSN